METVGFHDGNIYNLIDSRNTDVRHDVNYRLQMHSSLIQRLCQERELEVGHQGCVNAVAWNSKGSLLVSGSDDTRVNIWDYSSRKLLHSIDTGHSANIFCTKFIPETSDELVVSGAGDAEVRLFNLSCLNGRGHEDNAITPSASYQCHTRRVKKLAVEVGNPNVVWSASEDGTLRQHDFRFYPKKWYPPILASTACAGIVSFTWQWITLRKPAKALRAIFWVSPLLTCAVGILFVLIGPTASAGIGAVAVSLAFVQSLYACWVNPRFEYAGRVLSVSTAFPPAKTEILAALSTIASIVHSCFVVAGIGGATATGTSLDIFFISVILLSLAWSSQVIKNMQQVTISRVRHMNFASGADMDTKKAFLDTVRHLMGSVCVGSILSPIIVVIRGSARAIKLIAGSKGEFMFSCADCYSSIGKRLGTYGNRWAFVQVGVYNKGFVEASSDTWEMFRMAGMEQLIDSDLTGSFCFLSGVAGGAICSLAGGTWELLVCKNYAVEVSIYAFLIGYFVCRVAMAWPQACVSAYYVAYAENPHNLRFDSTIPGRIQEIQRYSV